METRQGKIESKTLAFAANKAPYATFIIDGKKYNSFDAEIVDNHNPDDFVEFTGEMKGKFWTMQTMKKVEEKPGLILHKSGEAYAPVKTNGAKEYHLSPEEVKCRALECAIEFEKEFTALATTEVILLTLADKFVEWIYGN